MSRITTIDPGPEHSGVVVWDNGIVEAVDLPNVELRTRLMERAFGGAQVCAIEMITCYGMHVGAETFQTYLWIGRFMERAGIPIRLCFRKNIKLHLCGTTKAKDGNVRQSLIDKHGAPGTEKQPGGTYGVTGHLWAALAVADYAVSLEK